MKRRIDAPEKATKRIEVGSDWVEIKTTMSYEQFMECQDPEKAYDKQKMLIITAHWILAVRAKKWSVSPPRLAIIGSSKKP